MRFRSWNTTLLTIGLAALAFAGCQPETERRLTQNTRRELELGRASAQEWLAEAAGDSVSETTAIAVGYFERLRLGLGSPFRLIDYALSDPRLDQPSRDRLAYALIARTLDGHSYEIDPTALDRAGAGDVEAWPGLGAWHLALIKKTIREAKLPRAAEAGIRIGYAIAAAEGTVSKEAPRLAGLVSALLVDRELAIADAVRLLAASTALQPPIRMIRNWREQHAFTVEQPRLAPLPYAEELASIRIATELVESIRGQRVARFRELPSAPVQTAARTYLGGAAAEMLGRSVAELNAPPQTPIVLSARQLARESAPQPWLTREQRYTRTRFANRALNEESFVVEHAALQPESPHDAARARVALQAAVSMRAYSQESVWYPGMEGPSQRYMLERYGLGSITFDRSMPTSWRPYYRRMLASSIDDLLSVLPAVNLRGLQIHIGAAPSNADALAVHYPSTRRLVLPPLTASGTLAHELAHDIDYQVALRRYRVRGDYATDRAARRRHDALAIQLRSLASASLANSIAEGRLSAHARRPAEIFARHVDWYVAVSLARVGRRNGYLSSVQDELITGYGTVRPPDVAGATGDALLLVLEEVAPVYRQQRDGFKALCGSRRLPRAYDLVRRVVEPTLNHRSIESERELIRVARDSAIAAVQGTGCNPILTVPQELQQARVELVLLAADARARRIALRELDIRTPLHAETAQLINGVRTSPFQIQTACTTDVGPGSWTSARP